jgi:hypothetical protein
MPTGAPPKADSGTRADSASDRSDCSCGRSAPGCGGRRLKSGGIDNGARVTTVNSSGESRVNPKVRDSELELHPHNKTTIVAGAISRIGVDKWLMAGVLRSPGQPAQDVRAVAKPRRRGASAPDPARRLCLLYLRQGRWPLEPCNLVVSLRRACTDLERSRLALLYQWTDCKGPRPLLEVKEATPPGGFEGQSPRACLIQAFAPDRPHCSGHGWPGVAIRHSLRQLNEGDACHGGSGRDRARADRESA